MHQSRNLDHLGIVAAVCDEIRLQKEIDNIIGVDPRQKVTCGEAVKAMVLNTLGFVDRPLYLFPEFMSTKPVELLIRKGLTAEDFNDDVLGRTLDKLFRKGTEEIFMRVAANAHKYGGNDRFYHSDTTSISVQGEYEHEEGDIDAVPIQITHGYSKDRRPDLKQFVVSLITCQHLPVFIQTLSGNASDRDHFRELATKYSESLDKIWGEDRIWVWDSAFYSADNLRHVPNGLRWITRVPETLKDAKDIISMVDVHTMKETSLDGYRLFSVLVNYGRVRQRWIVVFSEKAYDREIKTSQKQMQREKEWVEKELWHFSNQGFNCKSDALNVLEELQKKWRYHIVADVIITVKKKKKNGGRGRPKNGDKLEKMYQVEAELVEDKVVVQQQMLGKGKFIVATNVLDEKQLSGEEALQAYKDQQRVERGFRFLKDPLFFAHSLFLENEKRIMAMVMIMGLALLIYALAEKKLRKILKELDETVPDQKGKPTKRPTTRRMFQVFEGISVLYDNQGAMLEVMNIRETMRKVLSLFGRDYEKLYGIDT
jgi:transposase